MGEKLNVMRSTDSLQSRFGLVAAALWALGILLNLVLAMSPAWGWHPFLGWGATAVLLLIVWDERRGLSLVLSRQTGLFDRWFGRPLLTAAVLAIVTNVLLGIQKAIGP